MNKEINYKSLQNYNYFNVGAVCILTFIVSLLFLLMFMFLFPNIDYKFLVYNILQNVILFYILFSLLSRQVVFASEIDNLKEEIKNLKQ